MGELVKTAREFAREEDAVGVVEIILILVGLISLVIIFKDQLTIKKAALPFFWHWYSVSCCHLSVPVFSRYRQQRPEHRS